MTVAVTCDYQFWANPNSSVDCLPVGSFVRFLLSQKASVHATDERGWPDPLSCSWRKLTLDGGTGRVITPKYSYQGMCQNLWFMISIGGINLHSHPFTSYLSRYHPGPKVLTHSHQAADHWSHPVLPQPGRMARFTTDPLCSPGKRCEHRRLLGSGWIARGTSGGPPRH